MALVSKQPESSTLISVGHRPELEAFHSRKIVLERRKGGAKLVSDVKLVGPKRRFLHRLLRRRGKNKAA
jgi:putative ATP-binding cassette transporter